MKFQNYAQSSRFWTPSKSSPLKLWCGCRSLFIRALIASKTRKFWGFKGLKIVSRNLKRNKLVSAREGENWKTLVFVPWHTHTHTWGNTHTPLPTKLWVVGVTRPSPTEPILHTPIWGGCKYRYLISGCFRDHASRFCCIYPMQGSQTCEVSRWFWELSSWVRHWAAKGVSKRQHWHFKVQFR